MALAKKIRKTAVVSGVCDGFIGNRMLGTYMRAGAATWSRRARSPQQVDKAMEKFGFAMGPFRMGDLAGNDIGWAIRKRQLRREARARSADDRRPHLRAGRFGQKTGAGWYRYEPGKRDPIPDPMVEKLIAGCARTTASTPRKITDEEIVERCMYALVNEGAQDPRGGHRAARLRHRHGLPHRLRLPRVARRPDEVRRDRGPPEPFSLDPARQLT